MILFRVRAFILAAASLSSGQIAAQTEEREETPELIFRYGESCDQLAQLSKVEIAGITHPAYGEQFNIFCKTESVYRCADYGALLFGQGTLEDNGPTSCRYLPRS